MSIVCLRVIAEKDPKVFRDIEIQQEQSFLQLHECIKSAFEFNDQELGSFYLSDEEWNKGQEIVLDDLGEGDEPPLMMQDTNIGDHLQNKQDRLFYVYDFLLCKTFFLEVLDITEKGTDLKNLAGFPRCIRKVGEVPEYEDPLTSLTAEDFLDDLPSLDDEPKMESLEDMDWDSESFSSEEYQDYM